MNVVVSRQFCRGFLGVAFLQQMEFDNDIMMLWVSLESIKSGTRDAYNCIVPGD